MKQLWIYGTMAFLMHASVWAQVSEKIYIAPVELIDISSERQYSLLMLLKSYLEEGRRYQAIVPESDTAVKLLPEIKQTADQLGAVYFITLRINRLDSWYDLNLSLYNHNEMIWMRNMAVEYMHEIDKVVQETAWYLGRASFKADEAGSLRPPAKFLTEVSREASVWGGANLSAGWLENGNASRGMGISLSFITRDWIVDTRGQINYTNSHPFSFLSIHLNKPLTITAHTPYISTGMGLAGYNYNGGPMGFAGFGYLLNRNYDFVVRLEAMGFAGYFDGWRRTPVGVLLNVSLLVEP